MGVKYRCEYKSFDDSTWRVDLSLASYSSSVIYLRTPSEKAIVPQYDSVETDDIYSPIVKSSIDLSFYNQGEVDISELQRAADKDFIVDVYKEDMLQWRGYLVSEGLQRPLNSSVQEIQVSATDGLILLDDMNYIHKDLPVDSLKTINTRCPLNYLRQILFSSDNLGIALPIRWSNNLQCAAFGTDAFAGQVAWAVDDVGLYSYQTNEVNDISQPQKCGYILQGFMKAFGCRLYQAQGRWNIRRVNLIPSRTFGFSQVTGSLGEIVINKGTDSIGKAIGTGVSGAYPFIREDATVLVQPGLKSYKVEYTGNVPENILPNGSQDKVTSAPAKPYYWGFPGDTLGLGISTGPIDGRLGHATEVYNPTDVPAGPDMYFVLNPNSQTEFGLPIDGKTLVPRIQFGFVFAPIAGFPLDINGNVVFNTGALKIQVILNTYFGIYYLNENGFWTTTNTYITIQPPDGTPVKLNDSVRIDFNRFQGILLPEPDAELDNTKEYSLKVRFVAKDSEFYIVDGVYVNTEQNNDVYEAGVTLTKNTKTESTTLDISTSYGGYIASNFMSSWTESGREFVFNDGTLASGSLTKLLALAVMRCRYAAQNKIDLTINVRDLDWSFDEFYTVVTFGTSVFLPVKASYNTDLCEVKLTIIECRNDNVSLYTKHYGSNDNLLSN